MSTEREHAPFNKPTGERARDASVKYLTQLSAAEQAAFSQFEDTIDGTVLI